MKHILLLFVLLVFTLELNASQEIKRIDSIVSDIAMLRKEYKEKLLDEKEKNIILSQQNREYERKITNLENEIKNLKSLLKNRKNNTQNKIIVKEKIKKLVVVAPLCKDENPFPKLKLKADERVEHFKPTAFYLKKAAAVYDGMTTSNVVAKWDKYTSFTSNTKSDSRIKITGYFINKVWTKANREMWVDLSNVIKKF
ncbi:hypothetical protein [Sulfurimonas paralvinellae]|uniref:Uncharacterized protein n=1 Tax=Sulfurimonas paralvinellae TaxID=317658 RepID=A0A7M1B7A3_9BACT|nr:hypothetical protein [Sulfurimonas paralvinellae]QOP45584.1 hypothetical protein FM071_04500 [Sulfurimonas paralvinellae]